METAGEVMDVYDRDIASIDGVTTVGSRGGTLVVGVESEGRLDEVKPAVESILMDSPVPVEYEIVKPFRSEQFAREGKRRPFPPGVGTAPDGEDYTGTSGFLMTDGEKFYSVSNNHVYAGVGTVSIGTPIEQPSEPLQPGDSPPFKVGNLTSYVPITDFGDGDIAWAETTVEVTNEIPGVGEHEGPAIQPSVGMDVKGSGARTGVASGTIKNTNATVSVDYIDKKINLRGCLIVEPSISASGDSGMPVVTKDGQGRWRPVGINLGGNGDQSILTPAKTIERETGLSFADSPYPDSMSICEPDGDDVTYTVEVSGGIEGRDDSLEGDRDSTSGSTATGHLRNGCDKFQFEGPVERLSWEGGNINVWVNGSSIDLRSVSWSDPPEGGASPPPDGQEPGEGDGGGGILLLGAFALSASNR